MLIYLVSVGLLLANAQEEDCWAFGMEIQFETEVVNITSFADCYESCINDTVVEDCYYTTYIPATNSCSIGPIDSYLIDRKTTGYVFTDIDCLEKNLTERDACRIDDILNEYTTSETYKRSEGTIAECDEFCLGYDWCNSSLWWPKGDTDEGYCQTSETTTQVRSFTANTVCMESGTPCATGNVLDPDYGCVADNSTDEETTPAPTPPAPTTLPPTTLPPTPLIAPYKDKITCKNGKTCKVKFILSPPEGANIKKKHLKVCTLDGDDLENCVRPTKFKDDMIVMLKLKDFAPEDAGDYVCRVKYGGDKIVSLPVEVVLK